MEPRNRPTDQIRLNLEINKRRTSFALEMGVWEALRTMCRDLEKSMDEACEDIVADAEPGVSMASAIRTAVLQHFMEKCAA
jgi:predicted DNA-binding ribbon-helix-helix protein